MPLPCDLYLLINEYLDRNMRRALAQVSSTFDAVHQKWCTGKTQSLLQRCPFLGYLGLTRLTTMLRSGVTITYTPNVCTIGSIDSILNLYEDAIINDEYSRTQIEATITHLIHRRGIQLIPNCHPLFIFDYGDELIVLDDELNLYVDGERVLSGVADINFHNDYVQNPVRTEFGEVYDFESNDKIRRIYQRGFVNHCSGVYYIHDDYYLSNDEEFDMKVSDHPIVLLCQGDSSCLITCAGTDRTSFILTINDNYEVERRFSVPPVRMAVDIKSGYLVLLDNGSCAILREDIYGDQTLEDVIIQDTTYDHITRCEYDLIVARRGNRIYRLNIEDDQVIEEESDGFFPAPGHSGVYKLSY
jgi:hypothetical protein